MKTRQSEAGETNFQMKVHFKNVGGWEEEVNEPGGARTVETTIKTAALLLAHKFNNQASKKCGEA